MYTQDWDHTSLDVLHKRTALQMIEIHRNYQHLKPEDLTGAVRRILPIEYFSGAYADSRPVRKAFTDKLSAQLNTEIALRVA